MSKCTPYVRGSSALRPCCGLLASCKGLPDHPLNVSDHVPLAISLNATASETTTQSVPTKRVHWERAVSTDAIVNFTKGIEECARLYVNSHPDDITALEREIESVSEQVISIAHSTLPLRSRDKGQPRNYYNDEQLRQLCNRSKASWFEWENAGRPVDGPISEKKNADKRNVRMKLSQLRAQKDRSYTESIDRMFKKDRKRFQVPKSSPSGTRLVVEGNIVASPTEVSAAWASHFKQLGSSRISDSPALQELQSKLASYQSCSLGNEDYIFDTEIEIEEMESAIAKLKQGKSAGPDGIIPEHAIHSVPIFKLWLKKFFNCIVSLEEIPPCLSSAIVVPIYKGKGRNPLLTSNYRGISLTSVIGKVYYSPENDSDPEGEWHTSLYSDDIPIRYLLCKPHGSCPRSCQGLHSRWLHCLPVLL